MVTAGVRRFRLLPAILGGMLSLAPLLPAHSAVDRPNILLIVADDLGFSDLGAFGGEIHTPNLDALATQGVRITQFHAQMVCAPTRAELLSGTDTHIAGVGWMGSGPPQTQGQPGYEGYLNFRVAAVSELLQQSGYYTVMAGKWHLGSTPELSPWGRGFEHSFALLGGAALHFAPTSGPSPYMEDGQSVQVPADFYSSNFYATKLLDYLKLRETNSDDRPFFAYLAFTAPHWPLQVPPEDKDTYAGRYDEGPRALRQDRLRRQVDLGLLTRKAAADAHPFQYGEPWGELSAEERAISSRKMEIYAAMVDRMDINVGRVIDYLEETGELDNTVIIFMADNGAEGSNFGFGAGFDNRLENIGNPTSYVTYGINWAQAATAPSRLQKEYTSEGGIRVPAFITYPGFVRQGEVSSAFATVQDITPTILDVAGVPHPNTFAGRPIEPLRGTSMVRFLNKQAGTVHGPDEAFGWEQWGQRAIRLGDWKGVYQAEPSGRTPRWQVYNLKSDPGERTNLAPWQPGIRATLHRLWEQYAKAVGVVVVPPQAAPDPEPF